MIVLNVDGVRKFGSRFITKRGDGGVLHNVRDYSYGSVRTYCGIIVLGFEYSGVWEKAGSNQVRDKKVCGNCRRAVF